MYCEVKHGRSRSGNGHGTYYSWNKIQTKYKLGVSRNPKSVLVERKGLQTTEGRAVGQENDVQRSLRPWHTRKFNLSITLHYITFCNAISLRQSKSL